MSYEDDREPSGGQIDATAGPNLSDRFGKQVETRICKRSHVPRAVVLYPIAWSACLAARR